MSEELVDESNRLCLNFKKTIVRWGKPSYSLYEKKGNLILHAVRTPEGSVKPVMRLIIFLALIAEFQCVPMPQASI